MRNPLGNVAHTFARVIGVGRLENKLDTLMHGSSDVAELARAVSSQVEELSTAVAADRARFETRFDTLAHTASEDAELARAVSSQLEKLSNARGTDHARLESLEAAIGSLEQAVAEQSAQLDQLRRDAMLLLTRDNAINREPFPYLETKAALAIDSNDHNFPRGTRNDNTRHARFCRRCEELFAKRLRVLDLGCAGGGLVLDFALRGHFAVGLEGSDYSQRCQRAEWPTLPRHLFTCDITKPFRLRESADGDPLQFDVVSAWELLEHIREEDLAQLLDNIRVHLAPDGLFFASVATFEDAADGVIYHVTVRSRDWWEAKFREHGFEMVTGQLDPLDFPRGSGNGPDDWSVLEDPELGFHVVARLAPGDVCSGTRDG